MVCRPRSNILAQGTRQQSFSLNVLYQKLVTYVLGSRYAIRHAVISTQWIKSPALLPEKTKRKHTHERVRLSVCVVNESPNLLETERAVGGFRTQGSVWYFVRVCSGVELRENCYQL